jgi:hypothetical protein
MDKENGNHDAGGSAVATMSRRLSRAIPDQ